MIGSSGGYVFINQDNKSVDISSDKSTNQIASRNQVSIKTNKQQDSTFNEMIDSSTSNGSSLDRCSHTANNTNYLNPGFKFKEFIPRSTYIVSRKEASAS